MEGVERKVWVDSAVRRCVSLTSDGSSLVCLMLSDSGSPEQSINSAEDCAFISPSVSTDNYR